MFGSRLSGRLGETQALIVWTLAVETSGRIASLALLHDQCLVIERNLDESGRRHARTLVSAVGELLHEAGKAVGDLDLIAVSHGPGSFTGLRVGIVFAKTLAYAVGTRLTAVNTLTVIAAAVDRPGAVVWPLLDAQRGDVFTSRHLLDKTGQVQSCEPVQILAAADWSRRVQPEEIVTGPALDRFAEDVPATAHIVDSSRWNPSAARLGILGWQQAAAGNTVSPFELTPFYLRKSAAEEKWEQRQSESL